MRKSQFLDGYLAIRSMMAAVWSAIDCRQCSSV